MIRIALFDYGGVLTEGGKLGSVRAMFARGYGVEPEKVALDRSVQAAFCGRITDDEFVAAINRLNPQYPPVTAAVLVDGGDIYNRSEPVYALAARLRGAGIATGVFSNVFASSAAVLRKTGCYKDFDPLFLSFEQHCMKPDVLFYTRVIHDMGLPPDAIVFIDDKEECLAPARRLGIRTVLAVSPAQIVRDVTVLLARENGVRL